MLQGFTPPYTAAGRSSLVPPPPWHYCGTIVSLACEVDRDAAQAALPDRFGRATGRAYGHFCDWQATTDGSELLDPVYSLYQEFFLLVEAEAETGDGGLRLFCPYIYVTQDISLVRGQLQGFPKKLASVAIARSFGLDHPASGAVGSGARLGASCAVKDRRVAEAEWRYTGAEGQRLGFLATPTFGLVAAPTIIGGADPGRPRLVRQRVAQTAIGPIHAAEGQLKLSSTPRDEIGLLDPLRTTAASVCDFALTVTGADEVAW